jgi:sugar transferase EpsL
MKRSSDILFAAAGLLLLAPLLLLIAVLVRSCLGSPILFRQQRPGLHGHPFTIYKFRTMTDQQDAAGKLLPDGDRLTTFGEFLRRYSLDELPELLNVLKGEMSLVGPRPLHMKYLPYYTVQERKRHAVRPGITGWAQVHGRNYLPWDDRLALDIWYVENRTFPLDLQILWKTIWQVLRREGVAPNPDDAETDLDQERRERGRKGGSVSVASSGEYE